jgi:hypothetical protein
VQSVPVLPHVADVLGLTNELVGFTEISSIGILSVLATVCTTFVWMP